MRRLHQVVAAGVLRRGQILHSETRRQQRLQRRFAAAAAVDHRRRRHLVFVLGLALKLLAGVALAGARVVGRLQPRETVAADPHGIVKLLARQRDEVLGAIGAEDLATASARETNRWSSHSLATLSPSPSLSSVYLRNHLANLASTRRLARNAYLQ